MIHARELQSDPEKNQAKCLFREVADERKWPADPVIEGHKQTSRYWGVFSDIELIGAMQLVIGDAADFPIKHRRNGKEDEDAWPLLQIPSAIACEVALTAILEKHRGGIDALAHLFAKMYVDLQRTDIQFIYAVLDRRILNLYKRMGLPFRPCDEKEGGGKKVYWGEETFPACLSLRHAVESLFMKQNLLWECIEHYSRPKLRRRSRKGVAVGG